MNLACAVLLSGGGTTLENILVRSESAELNASVKVVISSNPSAYGLKRAQKRNIPATVVNPRDFDSNEEFSRRMTNVIDSYDVDLILLAGFMFLYRVPDMYIGRVMNVHPALIPAFCGKGYYGHHVHEAVLERGVKITGCTVHFVDNTYDHGPIIIQKAVEVRDDDTPDSLAERVQEAEREAYPEAIRLFGEGRLKIEGRRVRVIEENDT